MLFHGNTKHATVLLALLVLFSASAIHAQTILDADGKTDTYTLIQNVWNTQPESPDCSHPTFDQTNVLGGAVVGHHLTQVLDTVFDNQPPQPVFDFNMHKTPDNDRCTHLDRQRLEIKAESNSPTAILAHLNDTMTYTWRFKVPANFKTETHFTHIHQIKAGDGDNAAPMWTITPRKGSPDTLQLIWNNGAGGGGGTVANVPLAPFLGIWLEARETVFFNHAGKMDLTIRALNGGQVLLHYTNNNIDMWRNGGTTFARFKAGLYRSLLDLADIQDEQLHFSHFCIAKAPLDCPSMATTGNPTPDFTFTAAPASQTTLAGNSVSYTVNAAPTNGFTGDVALSAPGLPAGVAVTFNPATISGATGSSTATISASVSTVPGTYSIALTGTSGTHSHVAPVSLVVTTVPTPTPTPAPDFTLTATPASTTATAGQAGTYAVAIAPVNGFTGTVALSASGLPTGATAVFTPASVTGGAGSSSLKVSTTPATPAGTYTITIAGTSGALSHTTTVSLTVTAASTCVTASSANATWTNTAIAPAKTGTFTASFDATPSQAGLGSVIAISKGTQTAYTGFANLVRFNNAGDIEARNGGAYAAAATIPFTAGVTYHFRLLINVTAHTYSIFVTPAGQTELTVGANFAFRTEQNKVTSLDHWGVFEPATPGGTIQVCGFTIQ